MVKQIICTPPYWMAFPVGAVQGVGILWRLFVMDFWKGGNRTLAVFAALVFIATFIFFYPPVLWAVCADCVREERARAQKG